MKLSSKFGLLAAALILFHAAFYGLAWMYQPGDKVFPEARFTFINGEKTTLAALRGKPVLVTFWATSCKTCIEEVPQFAKLYRELAPRGLQLLAVAMPYDVPVHVITYAKTMDMPYRVALDVSGETMVAMGRVQATPTTFLIAPEGYILWRKAGRLDMKTLRHEIAELLDPASRKPTRGSIQS